MSEEEWSVKYYQFIRVSMDKIENLYQKDHFESNNQKYKEYFLQ